MAALNLWIVKSAMPKLDECVSEILRIEREDGPDAVSLAEKTADEFLAPFSRRHGATFDTADRRGQLTDELRMKGPSTPLMDQIIKMIRK